MMLLKSTAA